MATAKITYEEEDAWDAEDYIPEPVLGTGPVSLELPKNLESLKVHTPVTEEIVVDPNIVVVDLPTLKTGGPIKVYHTAITNAKKILGKDGLPTDDKYIKDINVVSDSARFHEPVKETPQKGLMFTNEALKERVGDILGVLNTKNDADFRMWTIAFSGSEREKIVEKVCSLQVNGMILSKRIKKPLEKYKPNWGADSQKNKHMTEVYNTIVYLLCKKNFANNDVFILLTYLGILMC
jgi:hypothetical protein